MDKNTSSKRKTVKTRRHWFPLTLLVSICQLLASLVFLFSGFTKLIDPKGTAYKISDYLAYAGLFIPIEYIPLILSICLGTVEFLLGMYLLLGIRRKFTSLCLLAFVLFFTIATLYSATYNPVANCGCFGDAVVLTNWQTFEKNMVLLLTSLIIFFNHKKMYLMVPQNVHWIISLYTIVFALGFAFYSNHYLPLMDFRPYRIGVNISEAMEIPRDADLPEYETTFLMEKNGERKRFTLNDYPDTTWMQISSETRMIKEGYVPPIIDFTITDDKRGDITEEILTDTNMTFLLISPHLSKADNVTDEIGNLYDFCSDNHHHLCALTASIPKEIEEWRYRTGAVFPIYHADEIVLKTMIRSNPGLILMKGSTILNKWSSNDIPNFYDDNKLTINTLTQNSRYIRAFGVLIKLVLVYLIPLIFIIFASNLWRNRKQLKNHNHKPYNKNFKMRQKIVAGNWKMNMNLQEGVALATSINDAMKADKPNCGVVICTPFIHLATVAPLLDTELVKLGAENCADKAKGAYTGEVSAEMVKSTGAEYVILGHSERRAYYAETPEILKEKVNLALANGLKVIFCIGEVLEERESGKQNEIVEAQIAGSLFDLTTEQFANIVLAYEPVWAIGTGKTATAEQAEEMHAFIRKTIADKFGAEAAENCTILYGGSCKPSNAKELFEKPNVDGGLIGGAALKVDSFKGIIDAWK